MEKHSVRALHPSQVTTQTPLEQGVPKISAYPRWRGIHKRSANLPYFVKTMVIFTSVVEGTLT
jgi:hypothetical protein